VVSSNQPDPFFRVVPREDLNSVAEEALRYLAFGNSGLRGIRQNLLRFGTVWRDLNELLLERLERLTEPPTYDVLFRETRAVVAEVSRGAAHTERGRTFAALLTSTSADRDISRRLEEAQTRMRPFWAEFLRQVQESHRRGR
jgi:hypothetical protein